MAVHAYHADPQRLLPILKKYELSSSKPVAEMIDPTLNVPPFILPPGFDSRRDTPTFDFGEGTLLDAVQRKIRTPAWRRRVRRADLLFDAAFEFHHFAQRRFPFFAVGNGCRSVNVLLASLSRIRKQKAIGLQLPEF